MNISIDNETNSKIVKKTIIAQIELFAAKYKLELDDLSIAYVHDEQMTEVNQQYLQHEGTTDIITFDYREDSEDDDDNGAELIICVDQAKRQAREYGVVLENELSRLLFHGLLHLSGYDDLTESQRLAMSAEENKMLTSWNESVKAKNNNCN